MTKWKIALAGATLAVAPLQAHAATYLETFDNDFAGWETRFFGANSNAQNYYRTEPAGAPADFRGGNTDGLWISDGGNYQTDPNWALVDIRFDADFASTITDFSLDVSSLLGSSVASTLTFFDKDGNVLNSWVLPEGTISGTGNPGGYLNYAATSTNGFGGFSLSGYAQGNVSVDNVRAVTAAVPEPATWMMMIGGFAVAGAAMRRRRVSVRFA